MPKIYNANDLLRYLYKETSESETADISHLIHHHADAAHDLLRFSEQINSLKQSALDAHPTSINLILEYAHRKAEEATEPSALFKP
jgi:late competence protein required for DNA uptake (superfamily II DNA/RNA helicase)